MISEEAAEATHKRVRQYLPAAPQPQGLADPHHVGPPGLPHGLGKTEMALQHRANGQQFASLSFSNKCCAKQLIPILSHKDYFFIL